jgi:hydrogenase maturation protease
MLAAIGVGQRFCGDDAVGPVVLEQWAARYPETAEDPRIHMEHCTLPGLTLLDILSGYELAVLVDAVLGGPSVEPGSLLLFNAEEIEGYQLATGAEPDWGVAETLKLARVLYREEIPTRIKVLGIAAAQVELGSVMSLDVLDALPAAVEKLQEIVVEMLGELSRNGVRHRVQVE